MQCEFKLWHDLDGLIVVDAGYLRETSFGVSACIQGLQQWFAAFCALLVFPLNVLFVDIARIRQHDFAKCLARVLGKDRTFVTTLDEQRESPRVVNVRVAKDDGIDLIDGKRKRLAIRFLSFAPALHQTTLEHDRMIGCP